MPPSTSSVLSADELQRFCDLLKRRTGMQFGESKRYYVDRRVAERIAMTGAKSFAAYFAYLRGDAAEMEILINAFTVKETYFYREEHQLKCLSRDLLPELIATRGAGDKIRIWSIPCATGDEPYSIAIWLLENWPLVDAYNVEIVGSDIDTAALEDARLGYFSDRALSRMPPSLSETYFEPAHDGHHRIIADLRESVIFTPVNLIDATAMAACGMFDVIFCRNVLIYFDSASRATAARHLYGRLNPGGFICLGHTESLARITDRFMTRRFEDAIVYQRPAARR